MKTLKGWEESNVDLDMYLTQTPCEIDADLFDYVRDVAPANYVSYKNGLLQGGDPYKSELDEDGYPYHYYDTCRAIGNKFFYLGILPEFKQ